MKAQCCYDRRLERFARPARGLCRIPLAGVIPYIAPEPRVLSCQLQAEALITETKKSLADGLSRSKEINITVTGRKSGRAISIPVWFDLEGHTLYLVPVQGSDTQWYKNILKNPTIHIDAHGAKGDFQAASITDPKRVAPVVEKLREKYGAADVKKYYSKLDVAVALQLQ